MIYFLFFYYVGYYVNYNKTSFINLTCHAGESSQISFDYGQNLQELDTFIFYIDNIEIIRLKNQDQSTFVLDGIANGLHSFSWHFKKNSPEGNYSSCWLDLLALHLTQTKVL